MAPEDGLEVVCDRAHYLLSPGDRKYQIVIESLELAGEGALLKLLEERRKEARRRGAVRP